MLEVKNIWKSFNKEPLLYGVSLTVDPGETVCLLGPSGSGKSTLLRIIAGLETADKDSGDPGQILWDGRDISEIPAHQRQFGFMFQDYALFPHKNVRENVGFGLRMQGLAKETIQSRVGSALRQVNMFDFSERRVTDLSGGEQQRVALARALAPQPRLLMLDEPLGALDRALREQLLQDLRSLLRVTKIPTIYVTHDQEEAFIIADTLVILHEGKIVQKGSPQEVYTHPGSPWIARFLGLTNLVQGKIVSFDPITIHTEIGAFLCEQNDSSRTSDSVLNESVTLLIHPHATNNACDTVTENKINGIVTDTIFYGDSFRTEIRCGDINLSFFLQKPLAVGERVALFLNRDQLIFFKEVQHE